MPGPLTSEQLDELRKKNYNATLVGLKLPNPELAILRVRPDFPKPPHKPGQYAALGLGYWEPRAPGCQAETIPQGDERKLVRRAYSISHSILNDNGTLIGAGEQNFLEFYIVLVRKSETADAPALTPRMIMLKEGDRLFLGDKIAGHYNLDPVQAADTVVLLSTGTGEAPHNYMVWDLLQRGHQSKILSACCVRYRRDLGYLPTHEKLMAMFPNYVYLPLTTRDADTIKHKVYLQDLLTSGQLETALKQPLDPAHTHVFLCGNPKMIGVPKRHVDGTRDYPKSKGVIEILEKRGFQADQAQVKLKGNIHFEEYW